MAADVILDVRGSRWDAGDLGRDGAVAALAARQEGLVSRRQLRGLGLDWDAERRRVAARRLFRVAPEVFAVGYAHVTDAGRLLAALLAYPPGAVIGHRSSAVWWRLLRGSRSRVDVVAATGTERPGTRLHRGGVPAGEGGVLRGVPVTTVGRTLADLATSERPTVVERAVHEAQVLRLLTAHEIAIAHRASDRREGCVRLRRLLAEVDPGVTFRSHLERRFFARLRRAGAPLPGTNLMVDLGSRIVRFDAAWPEHRLAVEIDSAVHDTAIARRDDVARDADARAAGWTVHRLRESDYSGALPEFILDLRGKRGDSG